MDKCIIIFAERVGKAGESYMNIFITERLQIILFTSAHGGGGGEFARPLITYSLCRCKIGTFVNSVSFNYLPRLDLMR